MSCLTSVVAKVRELQSKGFSNADANRIVAAESAAHAALRQALHAATSADPFAPLDAALAKFRDTLNAARARRAARK